MCKQKGLHIFYKQTAYRQIMKETPYSVPLVGKAPVVKAFTYTELNRYGINGACKKYIALN